MSLLSYNKKLAKETNSIHSSVCSLKNTNFLVIIILQSTVIVMLVWSINSNYHAVKLPNTDWNIWNISLKCAIDQIWWLKTKSKLPVKFA